ncbi:hypothetical protein FKX85_20135 [Echinicola soli]|uniref:DUF7793 domain-containing protein n=1 Tax=Echinicola soli TaxID=2591634 RepID=A0A514CNC5_9BACT|nr:hypothetical protein [Echinicola soli]QDH81214.1 hypothetical protein FKX85_20135 [Echinicola soli]
MEYIKTRTQEFKLLENGIIVCKVLPNKFLELEDGQENLQAVTTLADGKRAALLVDISMAKGISKECRELFGSEQCAKIQYAVGIVAKSQMANLIGNFFLGFNRPLFPTRLFTECSKAMEWLKTINNEEKK